MHEGYVTTRWGDEVLEELGEVGPERKQQIDDEISARRAELRRQGQEQQAVLEDESDDDSDEPVTGTAMMRTRRLTARPPESS